MTEVLPYAPPTLSRPRRWTAANLANDALLLALGSAGVGLVLKQLHDPYAQLFVLPIFSFGLIYVICRILARRGAGAFAKAVLMVAGVCTYFLLIFILTPQESLRYFWWDFRHEVGDARVLGISALCAVGLYALTDALLIARRLMGKRDGSINQVMPDSSWTPFRLGRRGMIFLSVAYVLSVFGFAFVPNLVWYARIVRAQATCLRFIEPLGTILYEENEASAAALARVGGYDVGPSRYPRGASPGNLRGWSFNIANKAPPSTLGRMAIYAPGSVLLMHELIDPTGRRRLVLVTLQCLPSGYVDPLAAPGRIVQLRYYVYDPATLRHEARLVSAINPTQLGRLLSDADRMTIYSAQLDGRDPSHFTFDYLLNGERHTLDGHLRDDAVKIAERKP